MSEDQENPIKDARSMAATVVPDTKRVVLALSLCRAVLDEFHGLGGDDEWQPGSVVHSEAPGEYVLWLIAYGQLLSLVGQDTPLGVGLEEVLGANSPTGPARADVVRGDGPTE